jgi:shikimate dehydrogenase
MTEDPPPSTPPGLAERYAVLGHPVAHSLSPEIHQRFAAQTGQTLDYTRLDCGADGFAAAVRALAGGHDGKPPARGCNVTVPFKFEAAALVRAAGGRLRERAALAQAANTLRFHGPDPAQWEADNTDGVGLVHDLTLHAGESLLHRRVLLIGAGGAAAGVLGPLLAARPAELVLANRSPGKASAMMHRHQRHALRHNVRLSATGLSMPGLQFDVVINASASSLAGVAAPVPALVLRPGTLAVDLMYGAAARPFLAWAAARGARTRDGLGMLVAQAAEAFASWRGVRPDTAPVLAALREQVDAQA